MTSTRLSAALVGALMMGGARGIEASPLAGSPQPEPTVGKTGTQRKARLSGSHRCRCGRTISANKDYCFACTQG